MSSKAKDVRNEFGKNLRAARIRAGLTQAQVAHRTGLTQQYVSLIEAGRQNLTLSTMTALAEVIGHEVKIVLRRAPGRPEQRSSRGARSAGGTRAAGK